MRFVSGASESVVKSGNLRADAVQGFRRGLGSTALTMIASTPAATEVIHQALLDRGGGLLGIFERQFVIRQFALRPSSRPPRELPEVGGAIDDEGKLLLLLRIGGAPIAHAIARAVAPSLLFHA